MSRHEELIFRIRRLVIEDGLAPGDRLPPERTLAKRLGASRGGVREAIRALAQQGAVASRRGDGTYLLDPEHGLERSLAAAVGAKHVRLKHIFGFRNMIEPVIARMAAENATARDMERLKVLTCDQQRALLAVTAMETALAQEDLAQGAGPDAAQTGAAEPDTSRLDPTSLDTAFHRHLARATGNPVVVEVMDAVSNLIQESRSAYLQSGVRLRSSVEGHLAIIDAMERRDPDGAERAMRNHLAAAEHDALDFGED